MRTFPWPARLCLVLLLAACAGGEGRRTPVPAESSSANGWVHFTVSDGDIPADPIARLAGLPARPPECELVLDLDGRPVLSEVLRPSGSAPPYAVESTFRVETLPGEYGATVHYSGCRTRGQRLDSVRAEIRIAVRRQRVTRIRFDGSLLEAEFPDGAASDRSGP